MKNLLNYKNLSRVAMPLTLVALVAASLWFASPSPAKALSIDFTSVPTSGTLGSTYIFEVKVSVQNTDLLPVQHINLEVRNTIAPTTYAAICTDLPIPTTGPATATKLYTHTDTGGGAFSITATTVSGWGYAQATRYGYGYRDLEGYGLHNFGYGWGYGYGYGTYIGETSITYSVNWTPPITWPDSTYNIKTTVYGDSAQKFSGTSTSFVLSAYSGGGGGGGGTGGSSTGVFTQTVTIPSSNGRVQMTIGSGTTGRTSSGGPLSQSQITIVSMASPPAPPADSSVIGLTYNLGPNGATFSPAITLRFTYDIDDVPEGVSETDLVIAYYNETTGNWVVLDNITVDTTTHTISGTISHFTAFAVIAFTEPAAFTIGALNISSTEVNTGETVTISTTMTNTGDLAGDYAVTLKINDVTVETKDITLAGHASQTVTFTTSNDVTGTYTASIDGQSGTFIVTTPLTSAAFTAGALNISPTEANIGETVTISTTITNTGDLAGDYAVALKINDVTVETKNITLAGHASQTVTFTTSRNVAGTYTTSINGQSGTFIVTTPTPPTPTTNWTRPLIYIIIGVIVVTAIAWFIIRRRLYY